MRQKRRSARRFRRALGVYAIALFVVIFISIIYLCITLFRYQKSYDSEQEEAAQAQAIERAPQEYFENYINNMNISDWVDAWYIAHPEKLDSEESVTEFIDSQVIQPGFTCFKAYDYTPQSPSYLIRSGNQDIATFYLSGQDMDWRIGNTIFYISGHESASITVPAGTQVTCNGVVLNDSYISAQASTSIDIKYADQLINPTAYVTMTVDNLIAPTQLQADNTYLLLASDVASLYRQQAEVFAKSLLHYYAQGKENIESNMAAVLALVPSGSEAADIIRQSYDGVIWRRAENISYSISVSDVYVLADNCYCVDVTYINTASEESDADVYRIYFLDLGSGFKLYSFSFM